LFLFKELTLSLNSDSADNLPSSIPETSICSNSIGTLSCLKTILTASEISAPIPSPILHHISQLLFITTLFRVFVFFGCLPGISVTVYFPPYFVGLKMSLVTVAVAIA